MSDLDLRLQTLVDAARSIEPTTADRARVRAALAAKLGASGLLFQAPRQPPPAHAPGAALGGGAAKLMAGALVGVVGFAGGALTVSNASHAEQARHGVEVQVLRRVLHAPRATESPTAPVDATSEDLSALPSAVEPSRVALVTPVPLNHRATSPPSAPPATAQAFDAPLAPSTASTLREEASLLRRAQTSLHAGDAAAALARLDELGARYPDGVLREERLAARVVALCAAGRDGDANREAERFLLAAPLSIHAGRVRASCAFGREGNRGAR